MLDGGAPFYNVFETKDGRHVCVGSIEPQFYKLLIEKTGLAESDLPAQNDRAAWPAMRARLAAVFRTRSRDEWCALMEGTDVCFAPVLSMEEAPRHPQAEARAAFVELDGVTQPAPAPRFSRTQPEARAPRESGADTEAVLAEAGFSEAERRALREAGVVR